jgi:hypothetical protein
MKTHLKHFAGKIDFWNFFIGLAIGFGLGVVIVNALVPNADELIKLYHLDKQSQMLDSYHTYVK